jgi:hypothetical protein
LVKQDWVRAEYYFNFALSGVIFIFDNFFRIKVIFKILIMKVLLKRFGLLFVVAGVVILAYSEFSKLESNALLAWSGGLIVVGLLLYIIINTIIEN